MGQRFTSASRFQPFLAGLLWFFSTITFAQTHFISSVSPAEINATTGVEAYKARLRKNPNIAAYHFVKLSPLATSQKDGFLKIDIPGKEKPIIAEAGPVKYYSETDYEWIGKTDEDRGTVIILSREGRVSAHISTPDGIYEIFKAPGDLYCLQEIDMAKAGEVGCATSGKREDGAKEDEGRINSESIDKPSVSTHSPDSNAKMYPCQPLSNPRVLVLYTTAAFNLANQDVATIKDQADLSIAQFNSTIYYSGIPSTAVLTLAGVAPLDFLENSSDMGNDASKLTQNVNAQNLRDQYQADLVVLYTHAAYGPRGVTANPFYNNSTAYSIVQILNSVTNKTFAHEVGHIYGCRHDGENGDPQYAQGYNVKNWLGIVVDRTLMSNHTDDGSNRLLRFSNPDIFVSGKPIGSANANNAKRVSETHLGVGDFRPNPIPQLAAYLNGLTYVTTQGGKNYELDYSCGSAPYTFVWQYSYDGVNYTTSNITTDVFTWYFYQNQKIYLKGTVKANGLATTAFIAITAQMPSPYREGNVGNRPFADEESFSVFPVPSSKDVNIQFSSNVETRVKIDVLDVSGKLIQPILDDKELRKPGNHTIQWNTDQHDPGTYLIRMAIGENVRTRRIIVAK